MIWQLMQKKIQGFGWRKTLKTNLNCSLKLNERGNLKYENSCYKDIARFL